MIKLMGLWEKKDQSGNTYFTGSLGGAKVLIFKNKYKTEEKHPDWVVNLDEKKKKEDKPQNDLPF